MVLLPETWGLETDHDKAGVAEMVSALFTELRRAHAAAQRYDEMRCCGQYSRGEIARQVFEEFYR